MPTKAASEAKPEYTCKQKFFILRLLPGPEPLSCIKKWRQLAFHIVSVTQRPESLLPRPAAALQSKFSFAGSWSSVESHLDLLDVALIQLNISHAPRQSAWQKWVSPLQDQTRVNLMMCKHCQHCQQSIDCKLKLLLHIVLVCRNEASKPTEEDASSCAFCHIKRFILSSEQRNDTC